MRLASLALIVASLLAIDDNNSTNDQDRIQGTWIVVKCRVGGRDVGSPKGPHRLVFEGEKMRVTRNGTPAQGSLTFRLDPSKAPHEFDLISEGFEAKGIYEFEGNSLRICYNTKRRPTRFDPEEQAEEPHNVLYELERQ